MKQFPAHEDAIQHALMKLVAHTGPMDVEPIFWLRKVIHNKIVDGIVDAKQARETSEGLAALGVLYDTRSGNPKDRARVRKHRKKRASPTRT